MTAAQSMCNDTAPLIQIYSSTNDVLDLRLQQSLQRGSSSSEQHHQTGADADKYGMLFTLHMALAGRHGIAMMAALRTCSCTSIPQNAVLGLMQQQSLQPASSSCEQHHQAGVRKQNPLCSIWTDTSCMPHGLSRPRKESPARRTQDAVC